MIPPELLAKGEQREENPSPIPLRAPFGRRRLGVPRGLRSLGGGPGQSPRIFSGSDVQVRDELGVLLDELLARLHWSPIRIVNISSAEMASLSVTRYMERVSGFMVVSQSCSALISPRPL
jgi:hypothetical protein